MKFEMPMRLATDFWSFSLEFSGEVRTEDRDIQAALGHGLDEISSGVRIRRRGKRARFDPGHWGVRSRGR